jgi:spore germination protein GerM
VGTPEPGTTPEPAASAEPVVAAPETPLPATPNTYRLYFLKLSPDGRMEPSSFARELPAGTTPLSATLKALLLGPTLQDKAQGALTMIPEGTKLLSVRLRDRTALVSLSPEFEHNASGLEGLAGQVRQVVWTATQFSSVDAVQILINGQPRDTLDGVPVAGSLTRASLP